MPTHNKQQTIKKEHTNLHAKSKRNAPQQSVEKILRNIWRRSALRTSPTKKRNADKQQTTVHRRMRRNLSASFWTKLIGRELNEMHENWVIWMRADFGRSLSREGEFCWGFKELTTKRWFVGQIQRFWVHLETKSVESWNLSGKKSRLMVGG